MSNVRTDIPASPVSYTYDMRRNFATIKAELEVLQAFMASGVSGDSPQFTGTLKGANGQFSGAVSTGALTPTSITALVTQTPTLIALAPLSNVTGGPTFTKSPDGIVVLNGTMTFDYTTMHTQGTGGATGAGIEAQLCPAGTLLAALRPAVSEVGVVCFTTSAFFFVVKVLSSGAVNCTWGIPRNLADTTVTGSGHVVNFSGCYKP